MATEHTESTERMIAAHALRVAPSNTQDIFRVFRGYPSPVSCLLSPDSCLLTPHSSPRENQ